MLPKAIIREISVGETAVTLTVEFQWNTHRQVIGLSGTLADWEAWKTANPTGTPAQFVEELIKTRYSLMAHVLNFAAGLRGKEISW